MSRVARVTGVMLLAAIVALVIGGWKLYAYAVRGDESTFLTRQLIEALYQNDRARAARLFEQGADVVHHDHIGRTVLTAAVSQPNPDPKFIQRIIARGGDVNAVDGTGYTPLVSYLTYHGGRGAASPAIVKALVPKASLLRRNPGAPTFVGIDLAVQSRDAPTVRTLLRAGADANTKDMNGRPVLSTAVETADLAVVKELIAAGADVNVSDKQNDRPLQIALNLGDDALAHYFVIHGADLNRPDKGGNPPVVAAVAGNLPLTFEALLARGAKVNARNKNGETALIVAARDGRRQMADALLKRHADVSIRDKTKRTARMWAAEQEFREIERALAEHGAAH
jgi:ankyrin repeat protein